MTTRRGFTLIEFLVVMLIIGVLAALGVDLFRHHEQERLRGACRMLEQEVAWARSATLTDPDDPASIRLLDDGGGWMVVRASALTTPLIAADGSPMHRCLGVGISASAAGVALAPVGSTSRLIEFEAYGGIRGGPESLRMTLQDSDYQCLVTFDPESGTPQVSWPNP